MSDNESLNTRKEEDGPPGSLANISASEETQIVEDLRIGRYRVQRILGKGSFGLVYLANDEQLDRLVAIKVPHAHRVSNEQNVRMYLQEARMVAGLDHANIVPVHDVGNTADYPCFIVSKYVDGKDLSVLRPEYAGQYSLIAELIATAARALHCAHEHGVIHRDVKPSNILIDDSHQPFLVDFGLAIREEDLGTGPRCVGTPAYMSPEQAMGEGHRVDLRTDVYSLGVVLYELLCMRRPFEGSERIQAARQDAKPPRQINALIPRELERICMRALARKVGDRYTTAQEFAVELEQFVADEGGSLTSTPLSQHLPLLSDIGTGTVVDAPSTHTSAGARSESSRTMRIVPKGLRSFDEHDAEFFLSLLPGPRDRHGLPLSIRFWKSRIEETDADKTFVVGLIYGPSGCGKSSLVKAGLLPRLNPNVETIYIECTPGETEKRIRLRLHKQFPQLPEGKSLKELLAQIRFDPIVTDGRKVLLVLDQFEQWLHSHANEEGPELAAALRQCDGGRVQCLLMVRDDFWMAATRFMNELEIQLLEGQNLAAVDLFPERHARQVLAAFGIAYGTLRSSDSSRSTRSDDDFLNRAVAGLSEDGKVVCVRLALFAEMMKDRAWTVASLQQVGGTQGIGARYLEEAFQSTSASPEHRYHLQAARAVLDALLPEPGSNIKGNMKSYDELQQVSGYADRPKDFQRLITLLDREMRLITPTDPAALDSVAATASTSDWTSRHYQLTHDYLVPSLRDWLTRKKKETAAGRTELLLQDRAAAWSQQPQARQLPSLLEYLSILWWTKSRHWGNQQSQMMHRAHRYYLRQAAVVGCVVAAAIGLWHFIDYEQRRQGVRSSVEQLLSADIDAWPELSRRLWLEPKLSRPLLEQIVDNSERSDEDKVPAVYVLSRQGGNYLPLLIEYCLKGDIELVSQARQPLTPHAHVVIPQLWTVVKDPKTESSECLRAAVLLAALDPSRADQWEAHASPIANALVLDSSGAIDEWIAALLPVSQYLIPPLMGHFHNDSALSFTQDAAARALGHYLSTEDLFPLLLSAAPQTWSTLSTSILNHRQKLIELGRAYLEQYPQDQLLPAPERNKIRNAIVTLISLGESEAVGPLLGTPADPTVRSMIIAELKDFRVNPIDLVGAWRSCQTPEVRQTLLLALENVQRIGLPPVAREQLMVELDACLRSGRYGCERAAVRWLMSRSNPSHVEECIRRQKGPLDEHWLANHDWWVNQVGMSMQILPGDALSIDAQNRQRRVAVSSEEVTMRQYREFRNDADFAAEICPTDLCPANKINLLDAMAYCRWLSVLENIPEDQMCYPPFDQISVDSYDLSDERWARTGYRLMTEQEYLKATRARAITAWPCGQNVDHLPLFTWGKFNSKEFLHAVADSRPNAAGFFDLVGNVSEWTHVQTGYEGQPPPRHKDSYILRGGDYGSSPEQLQPSNVYNQSITGYSFIGFRVARTLPAQ